MCFRSLIVVLIRKFTVHNNHISNQEKEDETIDKYRFSKINDIQAAEIVDKLHIYMNDSKPYLNNDLKQSDLADALGYSSHLLSQVFNSYLNCRYYDYINKYRVEEFKRMAEDSNYNKYTLTSLSEMCGFSSQSSFFRSFKKITGQTPNEYIHSLDDRK